MRGIVTTVTDIELDTVQYAHDTFNWAPEADEWIFEKLTEKDW